MVLSTAEAATEADARRSAESVAERIGGMPALVFLGSPAELLDLPITIAPAILGGKVVFAGTRIAVELIQEKFAAGETIAELLGDYPSLTREAIVAVERLKVLRGERHNLGESK